jgi:hypothetical protein
MIIDESSLSGLAAYLTDEHSNTNLAGSITARWPPFGQTVGEGKLAEIRGLSLHLNGSDIESLWGLPSSLSPPWLLSLRIVKEMFPRLYADPYANRVHFIGGFEDFRRGVAENLQVLEVDGIATLVSSEEGDCSWTSAMYKMPDPVRLNAAAWDMASARLAAPDSYHYSLSLETWQGTDPLDGPSSGTTPLTVASSPTPGGAVPGATPDVPRLNQGAFDLHNVVAYRVKMTARVRGEAYVREQYSEGNAAALLGFPLIRAITLLEPVAPAHDFYSLHEVTLASNEYKLFDNQDNPPVRFTAALNVAATLTKDEYMELHINVPDMQTIEARLEATLKVRPPAIDRGE